MRSNFELNWESCHRVFCGGPGAREGYEQKFLEYFSQDNSFIYRFINYIPNKKVLSLHFLSKNGELILAGVNYLLPSIPAPPCQHPQTLLVNNGGNRHWSSLRSYESSSSKLPV